MRIVLLISVCLLLVALGLQQELPQPEAAPVEAAPIQRDVPVTILATGWKMELPEYGTRKIFRGFFVGPHEYRSETEPIGLAVMALPPDGGVSEIVTFDMRYDFGDGLRFSQYLDDVEPGAVLLMGSCTTIGAAGDEFEAYNDKIRGLYRRIGAVSKPTQTPLQGFAFICIKREDGTFQAVAETYSETKGVRLSYVIPADRSRLLGVEPQRLHDARVLRQLAPADATGSDFTPRGARNFRERYYDCLGAQLAGGKPSTVTWNLEVPAEEAGEEAGEDGMRLFTAKVGMPWSADARLLGVRYTLHVGGQPVGDFPVWNEVGSAGEWLAWEQRIPASFGPLREVSVHVDVLSLEAPEPEVLLADVVLTSGRMRSL